MSSLIRRLSIRQMQRAGYTREKFIGKTDPITGERRLVEVSRGGEITDPDDNPIGRRWPIGIPASGEAAPRPKKAQPKRAPRGRRRGHPSKEWIAARAARKGAK